MGTYPSNPVVRAFRWWPFPADVDEYAEYRRRALVFLEARNRRMDDWVAAR